MKSHSRKGRALLKVITVMVAVALSGCGSDSSDFVATSGGNASAGNVETSQLQFGTLYLTEFPGRTQIDVLPVDSNIPLTSFSTNELGSFEIPIGTVLPPEFRLSAQISEGVTVERYVELSKSSHHFINIPSTLISEYRLRHPELSHSQVEAKIRNFLSIGEGGLYGTNDGPSSSFSHKLFLEQAKAAGGVGPFVSSLLQKLDRGETTSFRNGLTLSERRKLPIGPALQPSARLIVKAQDAGPLVAIVGAIGGEVGGKVVDEFEYDLMGKINAATGMSLGTAGAFDEVNQKLEGLTSLIEDAIKNSRDTWVQNAVYDLQTTMGTAIDNLDDVQDSLTKQSTDYQTYLKQIGEANQDDHGPAPLTGNINSTLLTLEAIVDTKVFDTFKNAFTADGSKLEHPVTQNLFMAINNNTSVSELGGTYSGIDYWNGLPLRRDDLLNSIENNYAYYFNYLAFLAVTISEIATTDAYLPTGLNPSSYDPPAPKLNKALAQINEIYGEVAHKGVRYVHSQVGSDLVLTDVVNGKQWYLVSFLGKYDYAQNLMLDLDINNWHRGAGVARPTDWWAFDPLDQHGFRRESDMAGWRLPELNELEQLAGWAAGAGALQGDESSYLTAMNKLGFKFTAEQNDHSNFKKMWYNGSVTKYNNDDNYTRFNYYDMVARKTDSTSDIANPFVDPDFSNLYVRTINYPSSAEFSDTGNQDNRSYGYAIADPVIEQDQALMNNSIVPCWAHGTRFGVSHDTNITDNVVWSVEGSNKDIAFLSYKQDRYGESRVYVNFRGAGTATIRLTFTDLSGDPYYVERQVTGSAPTLTSIDVTSKNVLFGTVPQSTNYYRFYATGYLSSGETVDLTQVVDWTVLTNIPAGTEQAEFSSDNNDRGNFQFGDPAVLPDRVTLRALYNPGALSTKTWLDPSESLSERATFGYSH